MSGLTLDEARAKLADAHAALTAAQFAVSIGDGGNQLQRASVGELSRQVGIWARTVRELEAVAAGCEPGAASYMVPQWD